VRAVTFDGKLAYNADYPDPKSAEDECLVRVLLAGICGTDLAIIAGHRSFAGVLGHEMVGVVMSGPPQWRTKRVVCQIDCICRRCDQCVGGLASHCRNRRVMGVDRRDGCFADLVAVPKENLHVVPEAVSDDEAVFVEPLAAAYQVLAQCPIDARATVSVVGAGRLGLLVAQVLATKGCKLTVIGRNRHKLLLCEKKGIQGIHVDELAPRQDRALVVECTGSPQGLDVAMRLVRPKGTIVLKSICGATGEVSLAPVVLNEVNLLGSRSGPFPEAINALARKEIDVRSMISRTYPIEQAADAVEATRNPDNVKVLLKVNAR